MPTIQLLILLLFSAHIFAGTGKDLGRGMDQESTYSITKTIDNKKLKSGETLLIINFICGNDKCLQKQIKFKMNDQSYDAKPDKKDMFKHKFKSGKFVMSFSAGGFNQLKTDTIDFKSQTTVYLKVQFEVRHTKTRKPVIYLYPEKKQAVSIKLDYKGELEFTYPEYKEGWKVTANPDGIIESDGKQYNYLFWDGKMEADKLKFKMDEGFVVSSAELTSFLDSTLSLIGLNSKEAQDFITFWVPLMQNNKNNYIHFLLTDEYDRIATIHVIPKPEKILRVFMIWSPIPGDIIVNDQTKNDLPIWTSPQELPHFERSGFTLVEWGGSEYPGLFEKITN
jgi:hypothetical protein